MSMFWVTIEKRISTGKKYVLLLMSFTITHVNQDFWHWQN